MSVRRALGEMGGQSRGEEGSTEHHHHSPLHRKNISFLLFYSLPELKTAEKVMIFIYIPI